MTTASCPTYVTTIYIAGDLADAKRVCRKYCMERGLCVTVEPTCYVYTGGAEEGVRVGLINYARFPAEPAAIHELAVGLAHELMTELVQHSFTIVSPETTTFHTRRAA